MNGLDSIRKEYTQTSLDIRDVNRDPVAQFEKWLQHAIEVKVPEPNAMTLSTISSGGRPSARIVLLKGVEGKKFHFYTNYQSQKGKEIDKEPACALTFFWPELERQVRIEGMASRVEESVSEKYFQSRPRGSQVGAWASPQSSIVDSRELLEARAKEIEKRYEGKLLLPKPKQWGGFAVDPFEIEFWQGRPNRLHDRIVYYKVEDNWQINRLAP
jgi:pyridoxamine 5'-phosphate oxidase